MGASKIVAVAVMMGLISVAQCQQKDQRVFNDYSPAGVPSYRATPRLVGVKVGRSDFEYEFLDAAEGRNVRVTARPPFAYSSSGAVLADAVGSHQFPAPISYAYVQQPGEPLPLVRRIRVNPSSETARYNSATYATSPAYAATSPYAVAHQAHSGGVQYTQTVPAVATYRPATYASAPAPAPYRPVASPQPQYYVANPRPKVVQASRPVLKVQKPSKGELEDEEAQYPSDPNPQYNFAFDVKDDDLTNYQNRQETRDGGVTKGSYSVVDPDGYVRTVTYEASSKGGFKAKVTREPTDVKIKFPVPTPAPEQDGKGGFIQAGPQQYKYADAVPQYSVAGGGGTARRYPHRLAQQAQYAQ